MLPKICKIEKNVVALWGEKIINRIGMEMISPKYKMNLVEQIDNAIWQEFSTYEKVLAYIRYWQHWYNEYETNFMIVYKDRDNTQVYLFQTLLNIDDETLIKIAIDMGIDTPDFIPSIPVFRNELKTECPVASAVFEKAFRCIESDPALAIGLANSALESIVKEVEQQRMQAMRSELEILRHELKEKEAEILRLREIIGLAKC